jgi:hypothetical protein
MEEIWKEIDGFSRYLISSNGDVMNRSTRELMSPSFNNFGDLKISLIDDQEVRKTKTVALLVSDAFLTPPDERCTHVINLNGDKTNVWVGNLALRPKWFAWRYTRQLKQQQQVNYYVVPVMDLGSGIHYKNVIVAGMTNGLLFGDVWRSARTGSAVYPTRMHFSVF